MQVRRRARQKEGCWSRTGSCAAKESSLRRARPRPHVWPPLGGGDGRLSRGSTSMRRIAARAVSETVDCPQRSLFPKQPAPLPTRAVSEIAGRLQRPLFPETSAKLALTPAPGCHPVPCRARKRRRAALFCGCELSTRGRQFTVTNPPGAPRPLAGTLPIFMRRKCDCKLCGRARNSQSQKRPRVRPRQLGFCRWDL